MRILVLGSIGMLGHKMVERLRKQFSSVIGVSRSSFNACDLGSVRRVVMMFSPDVIVNCVGVIKQREQNPVLLDAVNTRLPQALKDMHPYLIHFSTDCVFSGQKGHYTENDQPDPVDLYGSTKLAGEVTTSENALTIRTSIVGREIRNFKGLLEWFLRQQGNISGYTDAIFSGVTTNWLADTTADLIKRKERLSGLYQIAAQPVSKFELLRLFQKTYGRDNINLQRATVGKCDRSLVADKFQKATGIKPPNLEELLFWQKKMDDEESGYVI